MAKKSSSSGRFRFVLFALLLLLIFLGLFFAAGAWLPWNDSEMVVSISLATDDGGQTELYQETISFKSLEKPAVSAKAEIPLDRWKGKLVRIEIKGTATTKRITKTSTGVVGCAASLRQPDGATPIEFVGWKNQNSHHMHLKTIGSPAYAATVEGEDRFVYGEDNLLWHVVRVPPKSVLEVEFAPVAEKYLVAESKPLVPARTLQPLIPTTELNSQQENRPPDVFVYLIDTVRADHLGCYGYYRTTTPTIDAFAKEAMLFESAYSAASWTSPSVASILTGLYPTTHSLMHCPKWRLGSLEAIGSRQQMERERKKMMSLPRTERDKLPQWPLLLPEAFKEAGYNTFSIVTNWSASSDWGFDQGVDEFSYKSQGTTDWVNSKAAEFLKGQQADQPVYMYLHTMEPHGPYEPKADSFRRFDRNIPSSCDGSMQTLKMAGRIYPAFSEQDLERLIDLYDAELYDADAGFAEFLQMLRRSGRYENSIIIVLSDHGESFAEHDTMEHGLNLNVEELHVPLIIRFPYGKLAGRRVSGRANLIDLFPTVTTAAGINPKMAYRLPGLNLAALEAEPDSGHSRRIYAEVSQYDTNEINLIGMLDEEGYRRVIDMGPQPGSKATEKSLGLWNTKTDKKEQQDLSASLPVRAAYNEQLLAHWLVIQKNWTSVAAGGPEKAEMTEEMREELRALGYLD